MIDGGAAQAAGEAAAVRAHGIIGVRRLQRLKRDAEPPGAGAAQRGGLAPLLLLLLLLLRARCAPPGPARPRVSPVQRCDRCS